MTIVAHTAVRGQLADYGSELALRGLMAVVQVDQDGKPFSDADLKGGWALLYFGFTFCPDICPNELKKITVVVDALDKSWYAGPIVRPVLITVDPRRDSAPKMKDYIQQFHPRFVGLTGSEDQVRKVTKAYRVYFNPTNEDDENYLVSHSCSLLGPLTNRAALW